MSAPSTQHDADATAIVPANTKTIAMKTTDDKVYFVPEQIARSMVTIAHLLEDLEDSDDAIPIKYPSTIFDKLLEFMQHLLHSGMLTVSDQDKQNEPVALTETEETMFRTWFPKGNMQGTVGLLTFIGAANFLDQKVVLDKACTYMAKISSTAKSESELFSTFGIQLSAEERKELRDKVRKDQEWCAVSEEDLAKSGWISAQ